MVHRRENPAHEKIPWGSLPAVSMKEAGAGQPGSYIANTLIFFNLMGILAFLNFDRHSPAPSYRRIRNVGT
jgi:hypothetical protein